MRRIDRVCWLVHSSARRILGPFFVVATLAFGIAPSAHAQTGGFTITGRINGPAGEPVSGVVVSLDAAGRPSRGVLTDAAGVFRFVGVANGRYTLRTQHLGYESVEREITVAGASPQPLELSLDAAAVVLNEVVAQGRRNAERERDRFESEPGVTARVVEAEVLKVLPGLAEPDVLRAIELMPGVISTSDFSSSFSVRGGSTDQNLVLIDGFTVFNPVHLGGLFSVFNSDAVERAELFAGGFGAEFGGRVSSVLNIETRDDPQTTEIAGGVSMLASRALVRTPVPDGLLGGQGGSVMVSARRSYFDALLRPVADFPYHLTDLQTHVAVGTPAGGRLAVTGYWGEDVLDLANADFEEGSAADALRLRWNWGNKVLGARLTQPLMGGWVADLRAGYSSFAENLGFPRFDDIRFSSNIDQATFRADLGRDFSPTFSLRGGVGADRMEFSNLGEGGGTTFFGAGADGVLGSGYLSARWRPRSWILEAGVREDVWNSRGDTKAVFAPRLSAKRFFGPGENLAAKIAVGRYSQFVHSVKDEDLPVGNDNWVLAGPNVPAIVSDQVQFGVESFWTDWSASAEAYYRDFDGVTDLNYADDPNILSDDLLRGEGRSYGMDVLVRRLTGPLTGWAALTLLKAEQTFPNPEAAEWNDLPETVSYSPLYDRRFNLDLVLQYETAGGLELGGRWNFGTGLPFTRPVAQYVSFSQNPYEGLLEPSGVGEEEGDVPLAIVLGQRNSERYPAYHRLDITLRRPFERRWGTFVPYLQILNLYNQRNVLFYFYDYDQSPPVRSGFSMFPFLPAVGVEVSF